MGLVGQFINKSGAQGGATPAPGSTATPANGAAP
jgi:hypothetical protein